MRRFSVLPAIMLFASVMTGCSSQDEEPVFHTEGFVHEDSGVPFPATLAGFGQYAVVDEGAGIRVEYMLLRGGDRVSVSVRVYPNPDADPDEPKKRESTLQASESQAKRLEAIMQEIEESGTDEEHRFVAL